MSDSFFINELPHFYCCHVSLEYEAPTGLIKLIWQTWDTKTNFFFCLQNKSFFYVRAERQFSLFAVYVIHSTTLITSSFCRTVRIMYKTQRQCCLVLHSQNPFRTHHCSSMLCFLHVVHGIFTSMSRITCVI